jgi:rhodanese-related sulfurtransferase
MEDGMKKLISVLAVIAAIAAGVIWYAASQSRAQSTGISDSAQTEEKAVYHTVTAETAKYMMDEGSVTIVDVRTQSEYDAGHVENAILVPNETIGSTVPEELPDKEAVLLVYCRTGRRAADASQKLADMGYTKVYDFGGIEDWPYEMEKQ